ncbi:MAG: polysaccharide pyruvyl transferase family protein [Candidatus Aminicenantes bacterium]|nr:polysaccharide pyruvyl transferase family protein [Candidatus Aminicenantes bacterium]
MMSSAPPLIGLTFRCFPKEGYFDKVQENFEAAMGSFLAALRAEQNVRCHFFPFYEASAWPDTRALAGVLVRTGVLGIPVDIRSWANLTDLRHQIATCDAFIGVRFHSVLLAAQAGVPVLAISYAEKTANFMTENGLGQFVVRYEDVTAGGLKERWRLLWEERIAIKAELARLCAAQKALAARHFDLVLRFFDKERGDAAADAREL